EGEIRRFPSHLDVEASRGEVRKRLGDHPSSLLGGEVGEVEVERHVEGGAVFGFEADDKRGSRHGIDSHTRSRNWSVSLRYSFSALSRPASIASVRNGLPL